jgi:magnesium transporter
MLRRYDLREGRIVESIDEAAAILVYVNPDEREKKSLVDELKLDSHTLSSSLDPEELSRIEFEPEHVAMILKRPKNYSSEDQFVFKVSSMGMFLFENRLVVVLPEEIYLFDGKQFQRVTSLRDLLLKVINRNIIHYLDHLKVMNMVAESLEQKINTAMENRYLINLLSLEKGMVFYHNAIHSNGVMIDKLKAFSGKIGFTPDNAEFLDDIAIENSQCYKQAEIYSNIFASLMDARVSIVNNNLNLLMKTLNIVVIAIMVPTLVVSLFSMNVTIPLSGFKHAFWVIIGISGTVLTAFMLIWRRFRSR